MNLHELQSMLDELSSIDKDVKEINKIAQTISDRKTKQRVLLDIEDPEEEDKVKFDEDGSIIPRYKSDMQRSIFDYMMLGVDNGKDKKKEPTSFDVSDVELLEVLAVLLRSKMTRKREIETTVMNWMKTNKS